MTGHLLRILELSMLPAPYGVNIPKFIACRASASGSVLVCVNLLFDGTVSGGLPWLREALGVCGWRMVRG